MGLGWETIQCHCLGCNQWSTGCVLFQYLMMYHWTLQDQYVLLTTNLQDKISQPFLLLFFKENELEKYFQLNVTKTGEVKCWTHPNFNRGLEHFWHFHCYCFDLKCSKDNHIVWRKMCLLLSSGNFKTPFHFFIVAVHAKHGISSVL